MERGTRSDVILIMDQTSQTQSKTVPEFTGEDDDIKPQITTRAKNLRRLSFSKPKARLVEFTYPNATTTKVNPGHSELTEGLDTFDEKGGRSSSSEDDDYYYDDDDDNDDDQLEDGEEGSYGSRKRCRKRKKKVNWRLLIEWILFLAIMTALVSSLTITRITNTLIWGLEIWKWCLMIMVTFCGRLVSGWLVGSVVFLIERNFMLREKVLYFVYGLRKSIQNCAWLALVLLAWTCMFNEEVHYKRHRMVFQGLVAALVDATIWLIKIVLVKMLASSFHVATYFDRMKESVFHHYILDTLSRPPPVDAPEMGNAHNLSGSKSLPASWKKNSKSKWNSNKEAGRNINGVGLKSKRYGKIDMDELKKISMERRASAWSLKRMISHIRSSGLSTISRTVDDFAKAGSEITSEWEARIAARRIFNNVAKPGAKYIEEEDLMRFLKRVEIHTIFPLFEGALETGKISKSAFRNWVVRAYFEKKSLAHSLNDTKTAVQQLHKLASSVVMMIIIGVTLLVMELATVKVIFFVTTQMVIVGVIFQNMCKTVFESIIFVFVMHPFDIGDRCVVDGVQMIVEEMNILTTVFLRYDMEKIYYPNSVLLTKPISNFYRSPEMCDAIDFSIDMTTSMETIVALKKAIQVYIESKPKYWNPKHSVIVKGLEKVHSLTMSLCVQHTINHQNYGERNLRITELILELKKMFESLGIQYRLLPQEIRVSEININNNNWSRIPA